MNEKFMKLAIKEAKKAFDLNEIPVGAIIVRNNEIIAKAYNLKEQKQNPLLHAEIIAINEACSLVNNWRLTDCDMYVTLEPCVMCAGAILNARIKNLYFGAYDFKYGACFSNDNIFKTNKELSHTTVYGGIMEEEFKKILSDFFIKTR